MTDRYGTLAMLVALGVVGVAHAQEPKGPMEAARGVLSILQTGQAPAELSKVESTADVLAIVHATVWIGDGKVVEDGTVVIKQGRIRAVASGAAAPAGARVIDGKGKVLTPGFVAINDPVGLLEIDLEPSTDDTGPKDVGGVHPSFSAFDGYNPESSIIPVMRREGITSAVVVPLEGFARGTSAWFDFGRGHAEELSPKPYAAVEVNFGLGGVEQGGGARPEAFGRLRDLLDDARLFGRARDAYDRRAMRETRASRRDLERMQDVLAGRIPLSVRVARAPDILRLIELARGYHIKLVLIGVEEGWKVAAEIAAAKVPVVINPFNNLPAQFDRLASRYDNAALLAKAGVRVALMSGSSHDGGNLRQEVGNAMAWGLDPAVALTAVTLEPARIFGVDRDYGTVAAGKVANLVLWNGSPFEVQQWATNVIVRGEEMPVRSRQTALFERYRTLPAKTNGKVSGW